MPFFELKRNLSERIADALEHPEITALSIEQEFTSPPSLQMGHLALACFRLSKILKRSSNEIAKEIAAKLSRDELEVSVSGPYVNFKCPPGDLYSKTISAVLRQEEAYGSDLSGKDKKILLEYCSPNVAKKLAFQHIRSTLIGNTLANVYSFLGYQTERVNFVGDWGIQFARLLAAVAMWGDKEKIESAPAPEVMAHLFDLYVHFHKDVEQHPDYLDSAAQWLRRIEEGDEKATSLWRKIREISLASMDGTLRRMNVRFDHTEGESLYISRIQQTLAEIKSKADARPSDGAWIVEVPGLCTPALVQKRDGTTLYLTRDLAAAIDRYQRFHFDRMLYVVSEQQRLHFQLLFGVLKKMGIAWSERCEQISFGTVLFGTRKMSTREGRVIFLEDLLNEARALALAECLQRNPSLEGKEEVAEAVGIGAVIFGELSARRQRDIEFDWKEILSLEGDTGPYVQYSLVRCHSLLEKALQKGENAMGEASAEGYAFSAEEEQLVLTLSKFRSSLHHVLRENEPYHLTSYLLDLSKAFNRFYYRFPVLQATCPAQRSVRLNLVRASRQTLANGLNLLGIHCPKKM